MLAESEIAQTFNDDTNEAVYQWYKTEMMGLGLSDENLMCASSSIPTE